jgi:cytochrome c-type biogenesis protein
MGAEITIPAVVFAGLLSFLSPCVLPLVPPYLCYIAGTTLEELVEGDRPADVRRQLLPAALLFVAGFATIFVALGATASIIGQTIARELPLLAQVAGVLIILMGLHFLGVLRIPLLYREARVSPGGEPATFVGAYLMGLAFALGWTPCIGPVLAAVLSIAASEDTVLKGAGLLALYATGLGIPFVGAALGMRAFVGFLSKFKRHLRRVEQAMGGLLVLTGIGFLAGWVQSTAFWLLETFPGLATLG